MPNYEGDAPRETARSLPKDRPCHSPEGTALRADHSNRSHLTVRRVHFNHTDECNDTLFDEPVRSIEKPVGLWSCSGTAR